MPTAAAIAANGGVIWPTEWTIWKTKCASCGGGWRHWSVGRVCRLPCPSNKRRKSSLQPYRQCAMPGLKPLPPLHQWRVLPKAACNNRRRFECLPPMRHKSSLHLKRPACRRKKSLWYGRATNWCPNRNTKKEWRRSATVCCSGLKSCLPITQPPKFLRTKPLRRIPRPSKSSLHVKSRLHILLPALLRAHRLHATSDRNTANLPSLIRCWHGS